MSGEIAATRPFPAQDREGRNQKDARGRMKLATIQETAVVGNVGENGRGG